MAETPDQVIVEQGVKVPMRDGTLLDAVVWRPGAPGRYPTLVERVANELMWRSSANGELCRAMATPSSPRTCAARSPRRAASVPSKATGGALTRTGTTRSSGWRGSRGQTARLG
jgi:predicted acyl esterase